MPGVTRQFEVSTTGPGFYEITAPVQSWIAEQDGSVGLLTLFIRHSSASLLIQENADPDVQRDLLGFLDRFSPPSNHPSMAWMHHVLEGPDDMPAHVKAAFLPTSLSIPVADRRLTLGTWQGIYLVEHRDAPHRRRVFAHFAD